MDISLGSNVRFITVHADPSVMRALSKKRNTHGHGPFRVVHIAPLECNCGTRSGGIHQKECPRAPSSGAHPIVHLMDASGAGSSFTVSAALVRLATESVAA